MPKIPVSLAEVSSKRPVLTAGEYIGQVAKFEYTKAGTGAFMFSMEVTTKDPNGSKFTLFENIVITNKDGAPNEPGMRRLKNIIEQIFGEEEANNPEFDTDELVGLDVQIEVVAKMGKDEFGEPSPENRIKRFVKA